MKWNLISTTQKNVNIGPISFQCELLYQHVIVVYWGPYENRHTNVYGYWGLVMNNSTGHVFQ
jgi:hypothetical protein